jgi:hypothetical protein
MYIYDSSHLRVKKHCHEECVSVVTYVHSFLTLVLDRGDWPAARPHHFKLEKEFPVFICHKAGAFR